MLYVGATLATFLLAAGAKWRNWSPLRVCARSCYRSGGSRQWPRHPAPLGRTDL